jgi:hypothetical protein
MDRMQKGHGAAKGPWLGDEESDGRPADAAARRQAAAYLREARLTDDPAQREALRRRAAELLAPSRRAGKARAQEPR